jgi:anti-anti-sigma factor
MQVGITMINSRVYAAQAAGVTPLYVATVSSHRNGHTVRLACRWPTSSLAVISTHGGIDASNAGSLTDYVVAHVTRCRALVLDLSDLDFFGTEGFSALHRVSVSCARVGTGWAMVPGAAVTRVLRICDPQGSLPTTRTVEAAAATFADLPVRPPQPFASRTPSVRCERDTCTVCGGRLRSAANTGS